jgi:disulfide bond formation protein DsbB
VASAPVLTLIVAAGSMLGSLYLERAHHPCRLCWFQRTRYPIALVALVALIHNDAAHLPWRRSVR